MFDTPSRLATLAFVTLTVACAGDAETPEEGADAEAPVTSQTLAPTSTDIWLAPLLRDAEGALQLGEAVNITEREGYDNQPLFMPDGSGLWYTAIDDAGQADIWSYDLESRTTSQITSTAPESEYSATPLPDGSGVAVIRVEADSTQRLWLLSGEGSEDEVLFPDLAPVGYQAWADANTAVLFVLGDPPTLQVVDRPTGNARVVARNVGRSLHRIPGTSDGVTAAISYTQRGEGGTEIRALDVAAAESRLLAPGIGGGDFHAWTPAGELLQANGSQLMIWTEAHPMWMPVADFTDRGLTLSRLAVSPDGRWIALVGEGR